MDLRTYGNFGSSEKTAAPKKNICNKTKIDSSHNINSSKDNSNNIGRNCY